MEAPGNDPTLLTPTSQDPAYKQPPLTISLQRVSVFKIDDNISDLAPVLVFPPHVPRPPSGAAAAAPVCGSRAPGPTAAAQMQT